MADLFTAIAERHRRDILDTLLEGEQAVGALVAHLSLAQPQVSKHLRVLSEVGLVRSRADGRRRLYSVDPDAPGAVQGLAEQVRAGDERPA